MDLLAQDRISSVFAECPQPTSSGAASAIGFTSGQSPTSHDQAHRSTVDHPLPFTTATLSWVTAKLRIAGDS
jgi:hypothetical protein